MSHADLTFAAWLDLSGEAAGRTAVAVARSTETSFVGIAPHAYAGRQGRVAFFDRDNLRYALVPGGTAQLGHDPDGFVASSQQRSDFAEAVAEYNLTTPLNRFLAGTVSPPRQVFLPARLVAVQSEETDALLARQEDTALDASNDECGHAGLIAGLARQGLRPPTPDEWEYACAAGAASLFRWGDGYPDGGLDAEEPFLQQPNLFGLIIGNDPYRAEFTTDPEVLCGGDGGSALCGGYGRFLTWLTLATDYRDSALAHAIYGGSLTGETPVRPVLPIP
uniref:hypothetical protein n=1 Tax=Micromonospora acroterricola TaxID=2202421 RepID=UPI0011B70BC6|nr:hypothetical protein [Micromonospora acroterricola]